MSISATFARLMCRGLLGSLRRLPDGPVKYEILSRFSRDTSQIGEARLLELAITLAQHKGVTTPHTFLELGANHPFTLSNTWYLECFCGFSGVSVDPLPSYEALFKTIRTKTRFIRAAIVPQGSPAEQVNFFHCESDVYSTLDPVEGEKLRRMNIGGTEVTAPTVRYADLLQCPEFKAGLGILFIDVESNTLQLDILREALTHTVKPVFICAETLEFAGEQRDFRDIYRLLLEPAGYREIASTILNTVYRLGPSHTPGDGLD